ncbi:hypothetical protein FJTKL_03420 [Diaporthe vaccinii]|uniref:Carrier domain-containing protein n=1 Tax=Diaporthe vaccinii TaxID=105482 RepID=A0ABR4F245_9PEZI
MTSSTEFQAVPPFQEMLDGDGNTTPYPYGKTFEEARDDPIVVLHSSGSTGLPKPITITHGSIAAHDNDHNIPAPPGREKQDTTIFTLEGENRRLYLILPFFHLGGFVFFMGTHTPRFKIHGCSNVLLDHAILNNLTLVLGPPQRAPDAELLKEVAQKQHLRAIMVIPAILEQLLHDPKGIDLLKGLEFVGSGGAPLPGPIGDGIHGIVRLRIFIGSTETFPLPELAKSPEDWQYHEFTPALKHEMRPYDANTGTFELVIIADESNRDTAPVFHNLPGENPFFTKDLFTQHPTKPNLYKYYGRKDDILVLANGEKVNPIPLEQFVQADASLKGVLLTGNGRTQPVLIIEPKDTLDEPGRTQLLDKVWPRIEQANGHVAGPGRVSRGMVICATPERPFARTGKGTIIRNLTQYDYQEDIDRLYTGSAREQRLVTIGLKAKQKTVYENADIIAFIRQVLAVSFPPASEIAEDEDFFAHGLDSIQTLEITATLKHNLQNLTSSSVAWIVPRVIYQNSTLARLSKVLGVFLNDGIASGEDSLETRAKTLDDTVARYIKDLPAKSASQPAAGSQKESVQNIAIIGSTGYIGSHLVAALLKNSKVSQIYCLNRGGDKSAREKTLSNLDGSASVNPERLTFLQVDLGAPRLGLTEDQYQMVLNEADAVLYNAWRLDFGLALHSFDPFLRATRDLIDLSLSSSKRPRIVFVSSASSVAGLVGAGLAVPEAPVDDPLAAMNTGYGQSKLAAERILTAASRQCAVPVSVVRVGQVGGLSHGGGAWADQPWISAIIRSSKTLGSFPSPVVPIDWVPVDSVATILERIILQPGADTQMPQVYNVVSEAQPWTILLSALPETARQAMSRVVSLPDWVSELRELAESDGADVSDLPAVRLVDFYITLGSGIESAAYDTMNTEAIMGKELRPLEQEILVSWLEKWQI